MVLLLYILLFDGLDKNGLSERRDELSGDTGGCTDDEDDLLEDVLGCDDGGIGVENALKLLWIIRFEDEVELHELLELSPAADTATDVGEDDDGDEDMVLLVNELDELDEDELVGCSGNVSKFNVVLLELELLKIGLTKLELLGLLKLFNSGVFESKDGEGYGENEEENDDDEDEEDELGDEEEDEDEEDKNDDEDDDGYEEDEDGEDELGDEKNEDEEEEE
ncbi:hypothetical protein AGMMS50233_11340 [Endomicrobiia bacterium]|nr:hypothetical protein AGMMS50233_11340 [Endomicrobiia bacterium]